MDIVLAVLLVLLAIALIVFVLFQTGGRSNKLSQSIAGGSPDNYTGKNKQRAKDKKFSRITTVLAAVFAVLVIVFAVVTNHKYNQPAKSNDTTPASTAAPAETGTNEATGEVTGEATEAPTEAPSVTEAVVTGEVVE